MREVTGPPMPAIAADQHLLRPVMARAKDDPTRPVAAFRQGEGFVDVEAGPFYERVRSLAKGLIASGVNAGDRVALMSATRLEWSLVDYAILAAGAVTVPIYETSSAEQVAWILEDSGAVLLLAETAAMGARAGETSFSREVLVIDDGAVAELESRAAKTDDGALDGRLADITTDQLATIVYTSGTTGRPKGCSLTHANLRTNVFQTMEAIGPLFQDDEVFLMFLPLAHILAKIVGMTGMELGAKQAFCSGLDHLQEEMQMVKPTMVCAVPRIFEKVYNGAEHKAQGEGHGGIFSKAADVAIHWSRSPGPITRVEHATLDPLVYRKIRAVFGGRLRFAFSGGGPLGERLTHFYNGVGIKIFEGYGLTETSPTLTVNRADNWRPGTVGRPMAATTIRIADDGEILARGPQVFAGYWHNELATADVVDDERWFHTGDVGEIDDGGFLRITGRKKEILVTAAGKNVAPAPLEDRLRAHALISQAVVVGDRRPFIAALVTLDEAAASQWAAEHGGDLATLIDGPELRALLQEAVDQANKSVSKAESIRKFSILPVDFTIAAGELTPTLKVRRSVVEKAYAPVIEQLYAG